MADAAANQPGPVPTALRVAAASTLCLLVVEYFHLDQGYLSVITTLLVMAQYTNTSFQKGVERILGRLAAVVFAVLLVTLLRGRPWLYLTLLVAMQLACNYVYASGRLLYAGLQMSAFSAGLAGIGMTATPAEVVPMSVNIIVQVVLGVAVANLVNWLTRAEASLAIVPGGTSLLPLRADWLSQSARVTASCLLSVAAILYFDLPVMPTIVSTIILGGTAGPAAAGVKAWQRAVAPLIVGAYGFMAIGVLHYVPRFGLLLLFAAAGQFVAAYLARASTRFGYLGLQIGLTLGMVLVGPPAEFSALEPVVQRLCGVLVGFAVSMAVHSVWPAVTPPAPAAEGNASAHP
jgi:uncharacterized membrane protein YccC